MKLLVSLNNLLETCSFKEFWNLEKTANIKVDGFQQKIRCYILKVLSLTFKSCPFSVLLPSLNFASESELNTFVKEQKEVVEESTKEGVVFVTNSSNQPIKKIVKDGIVGKNLSAVMRN